MNNTKKPKRILRFILKGIGAMALIGLLVFAYIHFTSPPTLASLFEKYYEPYEVDFGTSSGESEDLKVAVKTAYQAKNYKEAIENLIFLNQKEPDNITAKFALGNSFLQLGGSNSAENTFRKIIDKNDPLHVDQANWFLAMTLLKSEDTKACKKVLKLLSEKEGSAFQIKAKELLEEIDVYE